MLVLFYKTMETIRQLVEEHRDEKSQSEATTRRAGLLERVINALGDGLISLGNRLKSWYVHADSQSYIPVIHIE